MQVSTQLAAAALATLAAGGVAYALIYPTLSGQARAEKRQQSLVGAKTDRASDRIAAVSRRDQVAQSLKELDARAKTKTITLEQKIAQAGLTWTRSRFYIFSAVVGLVTAAVLFVLSRNPLLAVAGVFIGALGLPMWILSYLKKRRIVQFLDELPNAMDVIVRGIRSGLPLNDCIRIVASEAKDPVRTEFRHIIESQTLGLSIGESIGKLYERVPIPEANFFGIVIAIQQKAGGNLSEAIANLSKVLRERKKMKGKIQAMSMEAKSSAGIIAALPFAVALLVYLSSPKYIEMLWITQTGQAILMGCACWMALGVFIMKKMINFNF